MPLPERTPVFTHHCKLCNFPVVSKDPKVDCDEGDDELHQVHIWQCLNFTCIHYQENEHRGQPAWVVEGPPAYAPTIGLLMASLRKNEVLVNRKYPIKRNNKVSTIVAYAITIKPYLVNWYTYDSEKKGFVLLKTSRVKPNKLEVYCSRVDHIWVTRAGEWTPIARMNDRHLLNSLRLVKKGALIRAAATDAQHVIMCVLFENNEMATDPWDAFPPNNREDLSESGWLQFVPPIFSELRDEIARRKIFASEVVGEFYVSTDEDNKLKAGYEAQLLSTTLNKKVKKGIP